MNSQATMRRTGFHGIVGLLILGLTSVAGLARADVVLDWNAIMTTTIAGENPFAQTRFAAITQVAVFEAVNAITATMSRTSVRSARPRERRQRPQSLRPRTASWRTTSRAVRRSSTQLARGPSPPSRTAKPRTTASPSVKPLLRR
jgi:hypothetical protein